MKPSSFIQEILRAPFDETDNGGGGDDLSVLDDSSGDEVDDSVEEINLDDPSGGGSSPLSPDAIAEAVARGISQGGGDRRQDDSSSSTPQLTQAEFLKKMGRPEIGEDFVSNLFNADLPTTKKAEMFQQIIDQTVQHALRIAGVAQQQHVKSIHETYGPLRLQQEKALEKEFYTRMEQVYPSLQGHGKIIAMAAQELRSQGYRSQGAEKDAQALAIATARLIKGVNPNFVLKRAKGGGRAGMPQMAASVSGAGGGGARTATMKQKLSPAAALYAKPPAKP